MQNQEPKRAVETGSQRQAPSSPSRREFLGSVGGAAAVTIAAGAIGVEPLLVGHGLRTGKNLQDLPTKENLFFFARWQDVLIARLDISALQRVSLADHSRLSFLETRYHWDRVDLALQWQVNHGDATSEFGAIPQRRIWQTLVTYFF